MFSPLNVKPFTRNLGENVSARTRCCGPCYGNLDFLSSAPSCICLCRGRLHRWPAGFNETVGLTLKHRFFLVSVETVGVGGSHFKWDTPFFVGEIKKLLMPKICMASSGGDRINALGVTLIHTSVSLFPQLFHLILWTQMAFTHMLRIPMIGVTFPVFPLVDAFTEWSPKHFDPNSLTVPTGRFTVGAVAGVNFHPGVVCLG